jgi:hypothetical protein
VPRWLATRHISPCPVKPLGDVNTLFARFVITRRSRNRRRDFLPLTYVHEVPYTCIINQHERLTQCAALQLEP